jgi:hypothetical protein
MAAKPAWAAVTVFVASTAVSAAALNTAPRRQFAEGRPGAFTRVLAQQLFVIHHR